jgi:hypothetical protein
MQIPYCKPLNAGLASETSAVCRRIGHLMQALDREINAYVVEGAILDDIRAFRLQLCDRLEAEGWSYTYQGTDRMSIRQPGHPKPFDRHMDLR